MKKLGIYFGPKAISLVESEKLKVLNNCNIPLRELLGAGDEEKVPLEIKIAAAIKDRLRINNIEAKEVNLVLLGRDLIIRTFLMPNLPANEIYGAIRFEAKKYIPFKLEELVYDYQVLFDKANRKNLVLFVGVKRDNLEKYLLVFSQLNIKINTIEYAGFSILRLIQMAKIREKGIFAVVDIDLTEEDEVNFIVLENGFPLFSRDIILAGESGSADIGSSLKIDQTQNLEKLKVELRVSLDFYLRKFPLKHIDNIVVIAPQDYRQDLETFIRARGLAVKFIDSRKFLEQSMSFSLGFFKAYAVNLEKNFKNSVKIDLLPAKIKNKSLEQGTAGGLVLYGFRIDFRLILMSLAIAALPFIISYYRLKPIQSELASILENRPLVNTVQSGLSLDELNSVDYNYKEKIKIITDFLQKMTFVTGQLDGISRGIPEGLWLNNLNFRKNKTDLLLTITGSSYEADNDKERKSIAKFLNNLKENPVFKEYFKETNIMSLNQGRVGKIILTDFVIECRSQ